ncbi:MAG: tryptophan--tRNA ligase, partial [Patescibacteria group bacterium]
MKIFSGIQPSGEFHLGNYLGAIKNWVKLQEENEVPTVSRDSDRSVGTIFCVVNLHAITVDYSPKEMPARIIEATKDILAAGIDSKKATIFLQSDRPEHTELAWLLNTITTIGELQRMTQFKEKTQKNEERVGLFDYPVLMAADILLYQTEGVPVGEDQVQHVELARDLARRFNQRFGKVFTEPKALLSPAKRILGLDGLGKMSKSNASSTYIALNDNPETIREKIAQATTDQGNEPEISNSTKNLIGLIETLISKERAEYYWQARRQGTIKYSELKPELAEAIIKELEPFQKRRQEISNNEVKKIL